MTFEEKKKQYILSTIMIFESKKDAVARIIKTKGDCSSVDCVLCPSYIEKCEISLEGRYKMAVNYYTKKYGKDELLELLI